MIEVCCPLCGNKCEEVVVQDGNNFHKGYKMIKDDLTPAMDTLQKYLNEGCYIGFEKYGDGDTWGLYKSDGELIVSGTTFRELLVNLVNLR